MEQTPTVTYTEQMNGAEITTVISISRPINGFHGATLTIPVDQSLSAEKLDALVAKRVAWKVQQEAGVSLSIRKE